MSLQNIVNDCIYKINSKYGVQLDSIPTDGTIKRFGKNDHGWVTGKEWTYKDKQYYQITYGSWKEDFKEALKSWKVGDEDRGFRKAYKKHTEDTQAKINAEKIKKHNDCKEKWLPVFNNATPNVHEYLDYKEIGKDHGTRVDQNGVLLIPLYKPASPKNEFVGVQRIYKDPETQKFVKKFSYGIEVKGSFFALKDFSKAQYCYIAEGFATAATIQEIYPEIPVICAFNAANIAPVVGSVRALNPHIKIVIASDYDHESKTGQKMAWKARQMYPQVVVKIPKFKVPFSEWSDYNDLALFESKEVAKAQLEINEEEFSEIIPLGYNEKNYYYSSTDNKQIVCISSAEHNQTHLKRLISNRPFWLKNYPKMDEDENIIGISWETASFDLIDKCHKKGLFNPSNVRGIGVWEDNGKYVINNGQEVINRPEVTQYHYQKKIKKDLTLVDDFDFNEMAYLLDCFKMLKYKNEHDWFYLAAWVMQAQIFPVLPWRFHLWASGDRGSGKSTILQWVSKLINNSLLVINSSSAGIRQHIENDATSVIYDEAEISKHIQDSIEIARQMSSNSGYLSLRGTTSGNAIKHNTQCIFLMGSIQIANLTAADKSRFFIVEMDTIKNQKAEEFEEIINRFSYFAENKNALFTHAYKNIPTVLKNNEIIKRYLKGKQLESRLVDQLSIAIACFYLYLSDDVISHKNIETIIAQFNLLHSEYIDQNEGKDADDCYQELMQVIIDNKDSTTVAHAVRTLIEQGNYDDNENVLVRMLGANGIRVLSRDSIFIAKKSDHLKRKIESYKDFYSVLKRDNRKCLGASVKRIPALSSGAVRGITLKISE